MCLYFAGDVATCGASNQMHERARVDLVDFDPLDPDQQHMKIRKNLMVRTSFCNRRIVE